VQDPLALRLLDGKVLPGEHVLVDADPGSNRMKFERKEKIVSADRNAKAQSARPARR